MCCVSSSFGTCVVIILLWKIFKILVINVRFFQLAGRSGWQLPIVEMEYPESEDRYKWFAQFFLQGLVCPQLREYVADLLSPPDTVFKIWAKL